MKETKTKNQLPQSKYLSYMHLLLFLFLYIYIYIFFNILYCFSSHGYLSKNLLIKFKKKRYNNIFKLDFFFNFHIHFFFFAKTKRANHQTAAIFIIFRV